MPGPHRRERHVGDGDHLVRPAVVGLLLPTAMMTARHPLFFNEALYF